MIDILHQSERLRKEVIDFAKHHIAPFAADNDRNEQLAPTVVQAMAEKGYFGAFLPIEYGGKSITMVENCIIHEEIGGACSAARSLLTVQGMVLTAINRSGTRRQKDKWINDMACGKVIAAFSLTEPDVGSDAAAIQTKAERVSNGYKLNGIKKWTSFGQLADVFLIFAKINNCSVAFLVPRESKGLRIQPINGMLGLRGCASAELILDNCSVSVDSILGENSIGIMQVAQEALDYGRLSVACGAVGIGQACLNEAVGYASKRYQFGKKLRQHQLIQKMITEMAVELTAARLMCYNAAHLKDIHDATSVIEVCKAKYYAAKVLQSIASDCVQIHGANGCSDSWNSSRYFRDSKMMEIIEGTNQIHEILIATNVFASCGRWEKDKKNEEKNA